MSTKFYIAPYSPTEWSETNYSYVKQLGEFAFDRDKYVEALRSKWTGTVVTNLDNETYALYWEIPSSTEKNVIHSGRLSKNLQVVTLQSAPEDFLIEFILWYRDIVDPQYPLYLLNSYSENYLVLQTTTTPNEIVQFFET